jgi:hypothetical protein
MCRKCGKTVVNETGRCSSVWSAEDRKVADCLTLALVRHVFETKSYEDAGLGALPYPARLPTKKAAREGSSDRSNVKIARKAAGVILKWKTEGLSISTACYVMTHFQALRVYLEQHHDMKEASVTTMCNSLYERKALRCMKNVYTTTLVINTELLVPLMPMIGVRQRTHSQGGLRRDIAADGPMWFSGR